MKYIQLGPRGSIYRVYDEAPKRFCCGQNQVVQVSDDVADSINLKSGRSFFVDGEILSEEDYNILYPVENVKLVGKLKETTSPEELPEELPEEQPEEEEEEEEI